jgi:hypothetical protein
MPSLRSCRQRKALRRAAGLEEEDEAEVEDPGGCPLPSPFAPPCLACYVTACLCLVWPAWLAALACFHLPPASLALGLMCPKLCQLGMHPASYSPALFKLPFPLPHPIPTVLAPCALTEDCTEGNASSHGLVRSELLPASSPSSNLPLAAHFWLLLGLGCCAAGACACYAADCHSHRRQFSLIHSLPPTACLPPPLCLCSLPV